MSESQPEPAKQEPGATRLMMLIDARWFVRFCQDMTYRIPDHACKECAPLSDILIPGFQCYYHKALAIAEGRTPSQDEQEHKPDYKKLMEIACKDWADAHTFTQNQCKKFFSEDQVEGDSYAVPSIECLVEMLVERIQSQDERIQQLTKDIEDGFMEGSYARFKNLQDAEWERDQLRARLSSLSQESDRLTVIQQENAHEIGLLKLREERFVEIAQLAASMYEGMTPSCQPKIYHLAKEVLQSLSLPAPRQDDRVERWKEAMRLILSAIKSNIDHLNGSKIADPWISGSVESQKSIYDLIQDTLQSLNLDEKGKV